MITTTTTVRLLRGTGVHQVIVDEIRYRGGLPDDDAIMFAVEDFERRLGLPWTAAASRIDVISDIEADQ
jgi:hypothetical protein